MASGAVVFDGPARAWADMAAGNFLVDVPTTDGFGLTARPPATVVGPVPRLTDFPRGTEILLP